MICSAEESLAGSLTEKGVVSLQLGRASMGLRCSSWDGAFRQRGMQARAHDLQAMTFPHAHLELDVTKSPRPINKGLGKGVAEEEKKWW